MSSDGSSTADEFGDYVWEVSELVDVLRDLRRDPALRTPAFLSSVSARVKAASELCVAFDKKSAETRALLAGVVEELGRDEKRAKLQASFNAKHNFDAYVASHALD